MFPQIIKEISVLAFAIACIKLLFLIKEELLQNKNDNDNHPANKDKKTDEIFWTIACWTIISRLVIYMIAYFGMMFFKQKTGGFFATFPELWVKWDSPHFINIASHWYQSTGEERLLIGFFPVYPLSIKILTLFTQNHLLSSILISNISLIIAAFYLYKLVRIDFDEDLAFRSVKYFLIYPFSFFLAATFTDSLFLALTIAAFYYLRKKKWLLCGILGGFASGTRNYGLIFLIPAFLEYLRESNIIISIKNKNVLQLIQNIKGGGFLLIIPLGLISLLYINKVVAGDWFKFMEYARTNWNCSVGFFGDTIKMLANNSSTWKPNESIALWIPQLVSVIFMLVLIFYSFNKIKTLYIAYMIGYFLLTTSPTWLLSASRYTMDLCPIYILLGLISRNKSLDFLLTFISIMLLSFYTLVFTYGAFLM